MHLHVRIHRGFVAASLITALIVSGCGQSAVAPATASPGAGASAKASPSVVSDAKLVIATSSNASWLPVILAKDRGYFAEAGLPNLTYTQMGSATDAANALSAGQIHFAGLAIERASLMSGAGKATQCMVATQNYPVVSVIVSDRFAGKIGDWSSLKGKTLSVCVGGWSEFVPKYLLKKAGVDLKEVKFLTGTSGPIRLAALLNGAVDGIGGEEPSATQAVSAGFGKVFYSAADTMKELPTPFVANCVMVAQQFAQANPGVVGAVAKAVSRALQDIQKEPAIAASAAAKLAPSIPPAIWEQVVKSQLSAWSKDGAVPEAGVANVQAILVEYGILPKALPYAQIVSR